MDNLSEENQKLFQGLPERCHLWMKYLLQVITTVYIVAIAGILPFYFVWETAYREIGSNKSAFFRKWGFGIALVFVFALGAYLLVSVICWYRKNRSVKKKFSLICNQILDSLSVTDRFVIVYFVAVCLSYYYTNYPESSFLGAQGWFMGFLPQIVLIGSYFAISRFTTKKEAIWVVTGILIVSFVVFSLGVLNRYGVNPLGMESSGPEFISTIGNINWYCGYWSVIFPLGVGCYLVYEKVNVIKVLLALYILIGFQTGVSQGSDSGILVILAVLLITGFICRKEQNKSKRYLELLIIFGLSLVLLSGIQRIWPDKNEYVTNYYQLLVETAFPFVLLIIVAALYLIYNTKKWMKMTPKIFHIGWNIIIGMTLTSLIIYIVLLIMNTTNPGSIGALSQNPFFIFNNKWASSRGATWTAGFKTWFSNNLLHKVIGVGPDSMAGYIYNGPDEELLNMVQGVFGNNRLTNAHGEWISILANLGLLGLIGFAGTIISSIQRSLHKREENICLAFGISIFCYTIHNIFSFQQTMNVTQIFIVLGLTEKILTAGHCQDKEDNLFFT